MPLPPDRVFANDSTEPQEDPLGLFLSEDQNTLPPVPPAPAVHRDRGHVRGLHPPRLRFPAWHLATWPDAAWRARVTTVISQAPSVIRQIAARTPLSAVTVSAFAWGVIVGGSVVWLSGAGRHAVVDPTAPAQATREVPRATAPPVAPVTTAFANTPVVQVADSQTAAPRAAAGTRRAQFRGSLIVDSRPSGAAVSVNGRSVGQTPLVLRDQSAGSRAIRVALDGYEPWWTAVQVVANTETHLRAELKAQRVAAQP